MKLPRHDDALMWWGRLPRDRQVLCVQGLAGALMALVLLGAFYSVLRDAVRQGDLRRAAQVAHAQKAWRCTGAVAANDDCRTLVTLATVASR